MKQYRFIIIIGVVLVCVLAQLVIGATNYCRLCRNHVACRPRRGFGRRCGVNRSVVPINNRTKNLFVQLHNGIRSVVASGNLEGFKSARRMAYMQWDDELAKLALINARQCHIHYDKCRKTKKFPWVGQNVAMDREMTKFPNVTQSIYRTIFKWLNEFQNANSSVIEAYRAPKQKRRRYNHFTVLVQDRQTHVGCAAVKFRNTAGYNIYWVCNYALRNVKKRKVYAVGTPYAGCKMGKNRDFPGLCRPDEPIEAVPHKKSSIDEEETTDDILSIFNGQPKTKKKQLDPDEASVDETVSNVSRRRQNRKKISTETEDESTNEQPLRILRNKPKDDGENEPANNMFTSLMGNGQKQKRRTDTDEDGADDSVTNLNRGFRRNKKQTDQDEDIEEISSGGVSTRPRRRKRSELIAYAAEADPQRPSQVVRTQRRTRRSGTRRTTRTSPGRRARRQGRRRRRRRRRRRLTTAQLMDGRTQWSRLYAEWQRRRQYRRRRRRRYTSPNID